MSDIYECRLDGTPANSDSPTYLSRVINITVPLSSWDYYVQSLDHGTPITIQGDNYRVLIIEWLESTNYLIATLASTHSPGDTV